MTHGNSYGPYGYNYYYGGYGSYLPYGRMDYYNRNIDPFTNTLASSPTLLPIQHIGIITNPITHTTINRLLRASTSFCNILWQLEDIGLG